jgi:hypothetical protein
VKVHKLEHCKERSRRSYWRILKRVARRNEEEREPDNEIIYPTFISRKPAKVGG